MLCVYSVFVAICNTRNSLTTKRHAPVPARSVASLRSSRFAALACYAVARRSLGLRVFACYALTGAIVCRPTLRRFAPSLRAPFPFCVVPVVARLRRSTTGYCLSPLTGLKIPLASARNLFFNFRFIAPFAIKHQLRQCVLFPPSVLFYH